MAKVVLSARDERYLSKVKDAKARAQLRVELEADAKTRAERQDPSVFSVTLNKARPETTKDGKTVKAMNANIFAYVSGTGTFRGCVMTKAGIERLLQADNLQALKDAAESMEYTDNQGEENGDK